MLLPPARQSGVSVPTNVVGNAGLLQLTAAIEEVGCVGSNGLAVFGHGG